MLNDGDTSSYELVDKPFNDGDSCTSYGSYPSQNLSQRWASLWNDAVNNGNSYESRLNMVFKWLLVANYVVKHHLLQVKNGQLRLVHCQAMVDIATYQRLEKSLFFFNNTVMIRNVPYGRRFCWVLLRGGRLSFCDFLQTANAVYM